MKRHIILVLLVICSCNLKAVDAAMFQWKSHLAYGSVTRVIETTDRIYGLANGSLFAVVKSTEEIVTFSKQDGMNGGEIAQIGYDPLSGMLIIAYTDGLIDFLSNDNFQAMTDLQQKTLSSSKKTNKMVIDQGIAYLGMPFGILSIDISNRLIDDTYYIGNNGSDVNVLDIAFSKDSVFAISANTLYSIGRKDNKMDYQNWHQTGHLPNDSTFSAIAVWENQLFALIKNHLFVRKENTWTPINFNLPVSNFSLTNNQLFLLVPNEGIYYLTKSLSVDVIPTSYVAQDLSGKNSSFWLATPNSGIVHLTSSGTQAYSVNGPAVNIPYRLKIANDKLYMVAGQRWATETPTRSANIMIYDIQQDNWSNIYDYQVDEFCNFHIFDLMNVAVDPNNSEHFYVTTYGTGLLECNGLQVVHHYTCTNSPLESAAPGPSEQKYTRTDGALFDAKGNLWILNAEVENQIHVANPSQLAAATSSEVSTWYKMKIAYSNGIFITVPTPGEMFIDNRNENWKWIPSVRETTGLILLDDNGTPQYGNDDEATYRNTFTDQDGKEIKPENIYSIAQDREGAIWIGIENGLIIIPSTIDYKNSNRCEKIKIARNDGTGLADYLLETERITAIAVDGANRKWLGTQSSGVFLVSEDGLETIAHYTEDNSPLLNNNILSLAIDPQTGRVFIGTGNGLISFQGDAAMPFETYSSAYAYPNPVYPDYEGVITITGLMDNSAIHITDNAGNLVCSTYSNGGTAIWDGKTADGKRVASGVYNIFCNESANGEHQLVKILVMHQK